MNGVIRIRVGWIFIAIIFSVSFFLGGCQDGNNDKNIFYDVGDCIKGDLKIKNIHLLSNVAPSLAVNKECLYQEDKHGRGVTSDTDGSVNLVLCPDADLLCDENVMVYVNFRYLPTEMMIISRQERIRRSTKIGYENEMEVYRYLEEGVAFLPKDGGSYFVNCSEKKGRDFSELTACSMEGGDPDRNIRYMAFYWGEYQNYDWKKLNNTILNFISDSVAMAKS